jgi:hypothetical protein
LLAVRQAGVTDDAASGAERVMDEREYTVQIDPALRALWRARREGRADRPTEFPAAAHAVAAPAPDPALAPRAERDDRRRIVLRRDGARPLVFDGLPLIGAACDDPDSGARFELAVYVAEPDMAVAQLAMRAPEDGPARDVHHVEPVAAAADLDRLLDGFDPAAALPCALGLSPELEAAVADAARRLGDGYARFRDGLRRPGGAHPLWRSTT